MDTDEMTLGLDARKIKALTLVGSLAGKKYDTRITNSFASGAENTLSPKGRNSNKIVEKTVSATTKFFNNVKNKISR